MTVMFLILVAQAAILWLCRNFIMSFFIPGREDIIREGANFISIFVLGLPFFGIFAATSSIFRGSGHNVPTMILEISRLWVLRIPLSYAFAFAGKMGSTGVWVGMTVSNFIGALMAIGLLSTRIWERKVIEGIGTSSIADKE